MLLKCAAAHKGNPFATGYHIISFTCAPHPTLPRWFDRSKDDDSKTLCLRCSLASVYLPGNSSHKLIGGRGECLRNVCQMFAKELRVALVHGRVNASAPLLKGYSQLSRVMPFGECPVSRRTLCHINNAARFVLHPLHLSPSYRKVHLFILLPCIKKGLKPFYFN